MVRINEIYLKKALSCHRSFKRVRPVKSRRQYLGPNSGLATGFLVVLLLSSCASPRVDKFVSAFIYTDNIKEKRYLSKYNEIFPGGDLQLETSADKVDYDQRLKTIFQADQLPDIFSAWDSHSYQYLIDSGKLADLQGMMQSAFVRERNPTTRRSYDPVQILPVRHAYSNVMLINMDLLHGVDLSLNINSVLTYEDFLSMAAMIRERGHNFLVIGDPGPFSLGDLFFSAVVGWVNRFVLPYLADGSLPISSEEITAAITHFYSNFHELFPDPTLANSSRELAEQMFLNGEVLLIIGDTDQLAPLMKRSGSMDVNWLSFPQTASQRTVDKLRIEVSPNERGAALGDVLGVAAAYRVMEYEPILYNEVSTVIQYYTGLYVNSQRIQSWDILVPAGSLVDTGEKDSILDRTITFLDSINYVYYRPSLYLSERFNEFLNEESWRVLQGEKNPEQFSQELLSFISRPKDMLDRHE